MSGKPPIAGPPPAPRDNRHAVLSARIVRLRDQAEQHQRRADMARAELARAEAELRALDDAWTAAHGR